MLEVEVVTAVMSWVAVPVAKPSGSRSPAAGDERWVDGVCDGEDDEARTEEGADRVAGGEVELAT